MDNDQQHIDELQAKLFRDKLRSVEASRLEEAARRMARNALPGKDVTDAPAENDGSDKECRRTGTFRASDFKG